LGIPLLAGTEEAAAAPKATSKKAP